MTPEEIKRYFETTPPPQEVDWKPWAKITNSQVFLKSCYSTINNYKGSLDMCPAWWHLKDFYLLVRRTSQESKSENQSE
ncbi:hypothetical protein B0A79_12300 [Flavobacterium piscis]|uniref:DUF6965 domain-containing protein n=1 Tax=Flavobacterium piscis TaxID=1114874 RepID=A0ABX2XPX0_9FLAO|nr:hypothetical protein FLP_01070 [Flavobacterium piscis]OXG04246.1 hypothetical protein B0A79_12300 [Flavobacterium piscis]